MADDFRPEEDDRIARSEYPAPRRRARRLMTALIAAAAVLGFGVILVYAYNMGRTDGESRVPPVILAEEGPTKIRPETPGGMQVPDRDKEVFSRLEADSPTQNVERLLPPPERPMIPPAPEPLPEPVPENLPDPAPSAGITGPTEPPAPPAPEPPTTLSPPTTLTPPAPAAPVARPEPKPPAPAPSPAARTQASGQWRIQLSALRSEAAVRSSWATLSRTHSDLLGNLALGIERRDLGAGKGVFYRMQAGPIASRDAAGDLCTKLKQRKLGCIVVAP